MKELLTLLAAGFLLLGTSCVTSAPKPVTKKDYVIWIVADIHYIDKSLAQGPHFLEVLEHADGRLSEYSDEIMEAFVQQAIKEKPDAVIFAGDITYNGEKISHEAMAKKMAVLKKNGIQSLVTPGNHDIENPKSYNYSTKEVTYTSTVSPTDFATIYKDFGYENEELRDPNSLSYLYKLSDECWILMLDSAEYEHNNALISAAGGRIRPEQVEWAEEILKEAKEKNIEVITVMHHTLSNMVDGDTYQIKNSRTMKRIFLENDVIANFCGHTHMQYIKEVTLDGQSMHDIMTSSMAIYCHQFGVVEWKPHEELKYTTKKVDMEAYVNENNINDVFLNNFEENAREYFRIYSTKRLGFWFSNLGLSEQVQKELIQLKGLENLYLFTGTMPEFKDILLENGYMKFLESLPEEASNRILGSVKRYKNDGRSVTISLKDE